MNSVLRIYLILSFLFLMAGCSKDDLSVDYPTDGLISYFDFENDMKDVLGSSEEGMPSGGVQFIDGYKGACIDFDGISGHASINMPPFNQQDAFTVSFWINTGDHPVSRYIMHCQYFHIRTLTPIIVFEVWAPTLESANWGMFSGVWYHFAGTYDGDDIKIYMNGELGPTVQHTGQLAEGLVQLTIAQSFSDYWKGSLDELFIYNRALNQDEIIQLYNR